MLDRLLESKGRRTRSPAGVVASVAAHLTVIVIAVRATAQSRPRETQLPKVVITRFVSRTIPVEQTLVHRVRESSALQLQPSVGIHFDFKLPPIDFAPAPPTSLSDFPTGLSSHADHDVPFATGTPVGTFSADQVERQVSLLPGAPSPSYPEGLRAAGVEGKVVAEFTVNERGLVESDSVRFVVSDNALFEASVRSALRRMRFVPAEIGGRKVRQLVQMPFIFTIGGR